LLQTSFGNTQYFLIILRNLRFEIITFSWIIQNDRLWNNNVTVLVHINKNPQKKKAIPKKLGPSEGLLESVFNVLQPIPQGHLPELEHCSIQPVQHLDYDEQGNIIQVR
jgi:hypothetical protein